MHSFAQKDCTVMQRGTLRVSEQHKVGLDKKTVYYCLTSLELCLQLQDLQHWNDMELLEWV